MMHFRTPHGVTISLARNASDLDIYNACRAVGLLKNQTHSALIYGAYEDEITIDRARDGRELLTLDRVNVCSKV